MGGGAVNTQICVASAAVQEAPLPPLDAAGRAWAARLQPALHAVAQTLIDHEQTLTDLDAAAGDGDLGASMLRAAEAILALPETAYGTPASALAALGAALRRAIAGSSGPFYATALLRASRRLADIAEPGRGVPRRGGFDQRTGRRACRRPHDARCAGPGRRGIRACARQRSRSRQRVGRGSRGRRARRAGNRTHDAARRARELSRRTRDRHAGRRRGRGVVLAACVADAHRWSKARQRCRAFNASARKTPHRVTCRCRGSLRCRAASPLCPSAINQPVFVRPGNNAAPTAATAKLASQHQ